MRFVCIFIEILRLAGLLQQDEAFRFRALFSQKDFTRNRKLGFGDYLNLLLYAGKNSLQQKLNDFLEKVGYKDMTYSKQAFSKRRLLIRPEAILEFVDLTVSTFYKMANFAKFRDYLVAAIDGSRVNLPCTPELTEKYGEQTTSGEAQTQALMSCMYDVLNGITLDCSFAPCKANERVLAEEHLDNLYKVPYQKILLLFDRGYPSYELIHSIEERQQHYLMRCSTEFVKSFRKESPDYIENHAFSANPKHPLKVRLITLPLDNGETEYLITNLFDEDLTVDDFRELYHARWGIETRYNDIKNVLELENFTGVNDIAIQQDVYATVYLANLTAVLEFELQEPMQQARKETNKLQYKANTRRVIAELRSQVVRWVMAMDDPLESARLSASIATRLQNAVVPIRPNRSFLRKRKHSMMKYSQNTRL